MSRKLRDEALWHKTLSPNTFVFQERYYRRLLHWAVNTFDKEADASGRFWFSHGDDDVFMMSDNKVVRAYKDLRLKEVPILLRMYVGNKTITLDEEKRLMQMMQSEDRTDWYMAFTLILTFKKRKTNGAKN